MDLLKKSAPAAPVVALVPSTSSFDFLEGAFARAQKTRKAGLGVACGAVTVLTVLAGMGVSAMITNSAENSQVTQTQSQIQAADVKLTSIDNAGGYSADRLQAHDNERQMALKNAIGSEIDVVALVRAIQASAPAGAEVTGITFKDTSAGVTNAAPVAGASSGASTGASAAGSTGAAAASGSDQIGTVEIKGTVKSFALIQAWGQSVSKINGLSGIDPNWSGGGTSISTTLTATLTQSGMTKRAGDLRLAGNGKAGH